MVTVNDVGTQLIIGRAGENRYRQIEIDVSAWLSEYPDGEIIAVFRRPDGVTYQIPITLSGSVAVWEPTSTDTIYGHGRMELRLRVNDMLGKSALFQTMCNKSLIFPDGAKPPSDLPPGAENGQVLTWTQDGAVWSDPKSAGVDFTTDETLTLDPETKVLSVNTAKAAEKDNTLPITSAAVHTEIGNIEVLLAAL